MAFTRRSTSVTEPATAATVEASPAVAVTATIDVPAESATVAAAEPVATTVQPLRDLIEDYAGQVSSALQESMLLSPDAEYVPQPIIDGLKVAAAKLGMAYDPSTTGTFYFIVTQTGAKYLAGPALVKAGDNIPHVKWGDELIPLGLTESVFSDKFRLLVGGENEQTTLVLDPKGCALPISVKPDVADADGAAKFRKAAGIADTLQDLVSWLRNGVKAQGLYKLEDGQAFEIRGVSDLIPARQEGGDPYRILGGVYEDDTACRWYASDDDLPWGSLTLPAILSREGQQITVEQPTGNLSFKLRSPVQKLGDACKEGMTYKLLDYEMQDGKFGTEVLLLIELKPGQTQKVHANMALEQRIVQLQKQGQDDFAANPAHLIVDSIRTSKDGKVRVTARIITKADLENPLMQRLMRLQQQKSA